MYVLWMFDGKGKTPFIHERQNKREPKRIGQNCIGLFLKNQQTRYKQSERTDQQDQPQNLN